jgi:serine/threonine protein kinase
VEENDDFKPCVVKRVAKERLATELAKRSVAIEYLVTSYHRSAFIVRSLHFHEDYSHLCLYFDLAAHLPLAVFTHSPPHYAYFRADIEPHVRFVVAAVVLALDDLHALQVVYRAINNENIVIRENGYPLLTNLAHLHPEGRLPAAPPPASPFLSPEELNGHPLTRAADFWALGVLIFHMITGNYPNSANYREDEFNPFGISPQLADLVNRLLRFDPRARLGVGRMDDLKAHAFFYGFDWQSYASQLLPSPFSCGRSGYPRRDPVE